MIELLNSDQAHAESVYGKNPQARLWLRVLHGAIRDALHDPREAGWVGSFPSQDFKEVCRLAGFNPDHLWPRLHWLAFEAPKEQRRAVYEQLASNNWNYTERKDPARKGEVEFSTKGYHKPRASEV